MRQISDYNATKIILMGDRSYTYRRQILDYHDKKLTKRRQILDYGDKNWTKVRHRDYLS